MSEHTPGPWAVDDAWRIGRPDGPGLELVAQVYECGDGHDEANAQLIAAAPELLDACRGLVNTVHATDARCDFGVMFTPKTNKCDCSQHAVYRLALLAIAKAEGGAA